MTDKNTIGEGICNEIKFVEPKFENTYGIVFNIVGYGNIRNKQYKHEVMISVDGVKKHLTFKEFEEFMGMKYDR